MPDKMVTDHWDMPSTPGMEFWIRGHAVSIFGFCYLMMCSPTASAAKAAFFISVGIGVLYPRAPGVSALPNNAPRPTPRRRRWNAKFGYLTPDLPLKYPMHYVPEGLMLFLSLAGLPAIMETPKGKEA